MKNTSAILMASGSSTRMKRNKLFIEFEGKTFLERSLQLLSEIDVMERIIVISPVNAKDLCFTDDVQVVMNPDAKDGQSVSVRLGTAAASGDGYLFLPVDQPLLDIKTVEKILSYGEEDRIVYPKDRRGRPKSPVFFGKKYRDELLCVTGEGGGRSVRDNHLDKCYGVSAENDHTLFDVDTEEDFRFLERIQSSIKKR